MGGILIKETPGLSEDGRRDENSIVRTYSIPFRCLYSRNVRNLFMAGRDISVTHCALGTTRLMLTCATMGQVVGTAAAMATARRAQPRQLGREHIRDLQQLLVKDDLFILNMPSQDPRDLARTARVTATSSAPLSLEPQDGATALALETAQIVPVSANRIETLWLHLRSEAQEDTEATIRVAPVGDIWDFRVPSSDALQSSAIVKAGSAGWVPFAFGAEVDAGRLYEIVLPAVADLEWTHAAPVPGVCSAEKLPGWRRWCGTKATHALRMKPASTPFDPYNAANGVARPERWPNIWASDPAEPMPQSVSLEWEEEQAFNCVYLTFDTYLHEETYALPPFWRARECVRDYCVEARLDGQWRPLAEVNGNYHRRRIHRFETVRSTCLRLTALATNGDPSARIYEVRVYHEAN